MPSTLTADKPAGTSPHSAKGSSVSLFVAVGIYVLVTLAIVIASRRAADGHLIYPLDDTYIEMAMAKNIATHGVWGVSPYEFSSSASTPLYVLLLAITYRLFGVNEYAPLLLSWIFGLASICVASRILRRYISEGWQAVTLVAMVLFTPMFVIGTLGMENSLHLLLTLLFLWQIDKRDAPLWTVSAVTVLMVATRYEGLFFVSTGIVFLLAFRQLAKALTIAVSALVPVGAYALFSIHRGGYWLPNSVAIKGTGRIHGVDLAGRVASILHVTLSNAQHAGHLVLLVATLSIAAFSLRKHDRRFSGLLGVVAGAGCIHLATADVGWLFRYEDYLIGSGLIVIACTFSRLQECNRMAAIAACCLLSLSCVILSARSVVAAFTLPPQARTIYLQQWQMARFLKSFYPNARIAANDIGAINFVNDLHNLDLVGLATADVFMAKRDHRYSTDLMEQIASKRDIQMAIVFDTWFSNSPKSLIAGPPLPRSWIRVRRWTLPNEPYLGEKTVSFYALRPELAGQLRDNLTEFERSMPGVVRISPK